MEPQPKKYDWAVIIPYAVIAISLCLLAFLSYQVGSFNRAVTEQIANLNQQTIANDANNRMIVDYINQHVVPLVNAPAK